ncbi:MAG: aminotransferase [Pyramidobacter sp.]|jgi:aspartate/methionine/tyrosine aminotransferase
MHIAPFKVEEWINAHETTAKYNISSTSVQNLTLDGLLELTGTDRKSFLDSLCSRRLSYGDIGGSPELLKGICTLYKTLRPEDIVPTHGAAGANHHVFYTLTEPGDRVVSIVPTYQQLYSIPEGYGADVKWLMLRREDAFQPDLKKLEELAVPGTKMICIINPNNPAGSVISNEALREIVRIARNAGAWLLCDESYRHLTQNGEWIDSVADLYEKGIATSSTSKVFSMPGLRIGWIACRDRNFITSCLSHRDYNLISCGGLDDTIAALALNHSDKLIERGRRIIRTNLEIVDSWVKSEPHVSYVRPQGGSTTLIYYDFPMNSYDFCQQLFDRTGVFVSPGDCFEMPGCFRLGYASNPPEILKAGLEGVSQFMKTLE